MQSCAINVTRGEHAAAASARKPDSGPFGGKVIIRPDLDDLQEEYFCSLTGTPITFAEAMRDRGLCRSCTDRTCRGCCEASVEPPYTKCDFCREPEEEECPCCGSIGGYVPPSVDDRERNPAYCTDCGWPDDDDEEGNEDNH